MLFKPVIDDRYSKTDVVTHYGRSFPYSLLPLRLTKKYILSRFREEILSADVVALDEAHFLKGNFVRICRWLVKEGKRVIIAGLDLDFKEGPFGYMPQLLVLANEVVKLQAVCVVCGKPASRSQRIINGKPASKKGPLELIGGLEVYEPRCLSYFVPPR